MRRSHKSPQTGDNCTVVGWGLTENVRRMSTYSNTYTTYTKKKSAEILRNIRQNVKRILWNFLCKYRKYGKYPDNNQLLFASAVDEFCRFMKIVSVEY